MLISSIRAGRTVDAHTCAKALLVSLALSACTTSEAGNPSSTSGGAPGNTGGQAANAGMNNSNANQGGGGTSTAHENADASQQPADAQSGQNNSDAQNGSEGGGALVTHVDGSVCNAVLTAHPSDGATHIPVCSQVSYSTNPPSSGSHYPAWAAFGVYEFSLPPGFWVHNMEHGAVVITYNCPEGCALELQAATTWFNSLPVDAACQVLGATVPRALLMPDPNLESRFAASAWQYTLTADCFDEASFTAFYEARAGHGLENVCSPGTDFRGPGGEPAASLPADCGN